MATGGMPWRMICAQDYATTTNISKAVNTN